MKKYFNNFNLGLIFLLGLVSGCFAYTEYKRERMADQILLLLEEKRSLEEWKEFFIDKYLELKYKDSNS